MGVLLRCATLFSSVALVAALAGAPAALADDFSRVERDAVAGTDLVTAGGGPVPTALYSLRTGNEGAVRAYTASPDGEVRRRAAYVESGWSDTGAGDGDRARWIVAHSYPHVDLLALGLDVGLPLGEEQAIAGTQAALWKVLSGTEPDREANDEAVLALYDHLTEAEGVLPAGPRPLTVDPGHLEATAPQEPLGPLTVSSTGDGPVSLSLSGAPASWLVDAQGDRTDRAVDGDPVYLDVSPSVPAGVVTLHVRGEDLPLAEGSLFTGRDGVRTRPLVTAEPAEATITTTATVTWRAPSPEPTPVPETPAETPEPEPEEPLTEAVPSPEATPTEADRIPEEDLPTTGTWLSGLLVIAGALVVSGLIILVLGRKRRE
ncbi:thioester domain-containing protein [Nocardiopsis changdeensis]|uniref:Thioester domain-containing protein n=1 Tax=Nocardiopsis changdeensis TaxID=2831969 RepID=A0ABX8BIJ3_9ACTN|nr:MULTISPECIES: thioester domain-containing protein [Nocardiopsis]QUX21926.1 thioester domain-containing protein [Nocardiopsis changdeensis]QYX37862.1 thioester domain-containing protein [Nocardiopsis sp. MT53]